jgi:hypothetical protein
MAGGPPTCLTVTRAGGEITGLEFAASGTVAGPVILVPDLLGSGQDGYVVDDRVLVPATLIASNSGLAALVKTASDSAGTLAITFQIDTTTGFPAGFDATTKVSGVVIILNGGDIRVGNATLPGDVIDGTSRAALVVAAGFGVPATTTIRGTGSITGNGSVVVDIGLEVTFTAPTPELTVVATVRPTPAAASLPDTAADSAPPMSGSGMLSVLLIATLGGLVGQARARARRNTSRRTK